MATLQLDSFAGYQDYLEVHPDEFATLFSTILINVTGFFRDPAAWDVIRTHVIPQILASKGDVDPIRVWSAGCASGEEAYTIAMLLAEALGRDHFPDRVKIYATDVDEEALNVARRAAYTPAQIEAVPPALLERYFEQREGVYVFRHDFQRQVIFGRHDIISDAPIWRIDLLVCRNTLMYFNAETQARVLSRLHFALNEGGYLFLGRAETLMAHALAFEFVDHKRRISRKVGRQRPREPRVSMSLPGDGRPAPRAATTCFAAVEASPVAQLVVDTQGIVVLANDRARSLFQLRESDISRPLRELQLPYRPVELRSLVERSEAERRVVAVKDVEWAVHPGEIRWLDLHVAPLSDPAGAAIGTAVAFTEVTAYRRLQAELEESHHRLEAAYEEVQATIEELHAITDELRQRGDELDAANAFLQSVLDGLRAGVAVVDRDLRVLAWNSRAGDLWGPLPEEVVGQHFLGLGVGLPADRLRGAVRACLSGEIRDQQVVLDAVDQRGRSIRCEFGITPLLAFRGEIRGAILMMEELCDPA